jgi:hypothetical protein
MPHDRKGQPLNIGDKIVIPAIIKDIQDNPDYCNVTLETEEVMHPGDSKNVINLNAAQIEKVG